MKFSYSIGVVAITILVLNVQFCLADNTDEATKQKRRMLGLGWVGKLLLMMKISSKQKLFVAITHKESQQPGVIWGLKKVENFLLRMKKNLRLTLFLLKPKVPD